MGAELKPACERELCDYFKLSEMTEPTRQFIFNECLANLKTRIEHDPTFTPNQCPQAALTAAVITEMSLREGELEITGE